MKRRDFLQLSTSSALVLGFSWPGIQTATAVADHFEPNAFVRIESNGTVIIVCPRPEAGSDVRTTLPMIVAEELDVAWSSVKVVQAETDAKRYGKQRIWGSEAVTTEFDKLRIAGAIARAMLVQAAASIWKVAAVDCRTQEGIVWHHDSGRRMRYTELIGVAKTLPVPDNVAVKKQAEFNLIGKSRRKLDAPDMVTGKAQYGMDVHVPGMACAVVARAPSFGARVVRFDAGKAKSIAGVIAVIELKELKWVEFPAPPGKPPSTVESLVLVPSGVAVVAENTWAAMQGRRALEITWDESSGANEDSGKLAAHILDLLDVPGTEIFARKSSLDGAKVTPAAGVYEADYLLPFLAHATMEPMNCVADVRSDRAEFWAPVGEPQRIVKDIGVDLLGLAADQVTVHTTLIGGSFGRRSQIDYAAEAALLSRQVGRPIKLMYSREDDMQRGYYRPMSGQRIHASLDKEGMPLSWDHRIVITARQGNLSAADRTEGNIKRLSRWDAFGGANGDLLYPVPDMRTGYTPVSSAVPRASWRGVAHTHNLFAIECFIDELAHRAGSDPLAYRLRLLERWRASLVHEFDLERLLAVVRRVAQDSNWDRPLPKGWSRGFACTAYEYNKYTYIAQVVEISRETEGAIRVRRVVTAVDCGTLINPGGATAQIEGGSIFGLSAALHGEISISGGRVKQSNFHDYEVMRLAAAPSMETYFLNNDAAPGPLGEVATVTIVPALANAVSAARGKPVRKLPL